MDVIVRTASKVLLPFIIVFGVYIIFHGHLTPGGSFPGGAVMASAVALFAVAFGIDKTQELISKDTARKIEAVAALGLLMVIIFENFIRNIVLPIQIPFTVYSAGPTMMSNVIGGVMVASVLIVLVLFYMRD
jgi:multicomponent Na+:H+ antiporter subunit B